jgi:hypothetical protein
MMPLILFPVSGEVLSSGSRNPSKIYRPACAVEQTAPDRNMMGLKWSRLGKFVCVFDVPGGRAEQLCLG